MKFAKRALAVVGATVLGMGMLLAASPASAATPATATSASASVQTASLAGGYQLAALKCKSFSKPSSKHVTVPSRYCYNPDAKKQKTLHDFCTKSPDKWGKADFRGPCARHDLCIMDKKTKRSTCDSNFRGSLYSECKKVYGAVNPLRYECLRTASVYWAVVRVKTTLS